MQTRPEIVTQRVLRVVLPFAFSAAGHKLGGIRILTPPPYETDDYYLVAVDEDKAVFMKEDSEQTVRTVDLDMQCCDCPGYHYRRKCRHIDAIKALKARKIV